ncbi:MAG: hypothetical protein R6X27_17660, partial [Candidatus Desulfacyla sp.]
MTQEVMDPASMSVARFAPFRFTGRSIRDISSIGSICSVGFHFFQKVEAGENGAGDFRHNPGR